MKTAISLPDDLFEEVDSTAQKLGISRSELLARAAHAYLRTHSPEAIRRSYDRAYGDEGCSADEERDPRRRAARELLSRVEW